MIKNPPAEAEGTSLIPGLGRSPGEGDIHPFQDSCLENSMDKKTRQDSPWGHKESDMTEQLALSFSVFR